ncbi:MAG: hypothetical protein EZS28_030691 [Streblomastix strix]|uniref:Uncharacterized protein n=1 Tax=Streblomastix strix TaxID=222440 RepID=A0A5J4UUR8_9EUKA|nr:MAG: hypothetical protein EZS28_030691 [Streblomastix strix]
MRIVFGKVPVGGKGYPIELTQIMLQQDNEPFQNRSRVANIRIADEHQKKIKTMQRKDSQDDEDEYDYHRSGSKQEAIGLIGEEDDDQNQDSEQMKGVTAEEKQEVKEITSDEELYSKPRRGSAIHVKSEKPKQKEQPHKAKKRLNLHQRKFLLSSLIHFLLPKSLLESFPLLILLLSLLKIHVGRLIAGPGL